MSEMGVNDQDGRKIAQFLGEPGNLKLLPSESPQCGRDHIPTNYTVWE
jgi:hypothetical protein